MIRGTARFPQDTLDPRRRTGLILCGMGGPDGPETIAPFLQNLFSDPAIFPLPGFIAGPLGWMIGRLRAPKIEASYALMNDRCRTPQLDWTEQQAGALAWLLEDRLGGGADVQIPEKLPWQPPRGAQTGVNQDLSAFEKLPWQQNTDNTPHILPAMAMRYWKPFPDETVPRLLDAGCEQFLVVPMYPQFSDSTGGSTLDFVLDSVRRLAPRAAIHTLPDWHLLLGYLDALADPVSAQLTAWAAQDVDPLHTALIFVAHSLPMKFHDQGDPYLELTTATVGAVHTKVMAAVARAGHKDWLSRTSGGPAAHLAFQSKVGPIKWLGPDVVDEITGLAASGCHRVLVQPVSFTCDHVETLVELDVELRETAEEAGITEFLRGPALNLNPQWLASLASHLQTNAFSSGAA